MILGTVIPRRHSGSKGGLDKMIRLLRGLLFGILMTGAGWALFIFLFGLLDEGGAHEHDPGIIAEILLNAVCYVVLLPGLVAAWLVGDGQGIFSHLAVPLLFAVNVGFWGCFFELSWTGITLLKRKLRTLAPKV